MEARGVWHAMGARTRRGIVLAWTALFVFSLLLQYFAFAATPVLAVHDDSFQLDGNAIDDPGNPPDDWATLVGGGGSADAFSGIIHEAPDSTIFTTGGSKDINDTDEWRWTDGSVPDKDDLLDGFAALYGDVMYFGADRFANNGDSAIGFWFFKNGLSVNANGTFSPVHAIGDLFVVSHFENGGATSEIQLFEWVGSGGSDGTLDLIATGAVCTNAPAADEACGIANDAATPAPWPYTPKAGSAGTFPEFSFFEGGLDLSDVFEGDVPCFSSFLVETRSSQEVTAQLKDFIAGDFNTCVPPDIETEVSASTIDLGDSVTDTATLSGDDGPASGTVDFFVCGPTDAPEDCAGGDQVGDSVDVDTSANGGTATSDSFTPTDTGFWCFRVQYTPDAESQYLEAGHTNDSSECVEVVAAEIAIVKTANPEGPVDAGNDIGFDIVVSNNGNGPATDVHVEDPLPAGVDWQLSAVTPPALCQVFNNLLTCDADTLDAGASFTVSVTAETTAEDCATYDNTATVTTGNDGEGESSASVTVQCPDVSVEKTADNSPILPGEDAAFTITIANAGPGEAFDVHVEDELPAGVDWAIDPAVEGCEISGSTLTCDLETLPASSSIEIHVSGATDAGNCGDLPNTVTISASNEPADADGDNESSATIHVQCADVGVEKSADVSPISAGENAAFTITVTNHGPDEAVNVVLNDVLPAGVAWSVSSVTLNGSDLPGACDPVAGTALHCELGNLAVDDVVEIHLGGETDFDDCGTLTNTVSIGSDNEPAEADGNNEASAEVVVNCPDLGIVKSADHEDPVVAGGDIGFTVTIANNGEGTAFDVSASDSLPAGFSWSIESQSGGWSLAGNDLSFGPADLAAGEDATVHVVASTDAEDCGLVPNTAAIFQGETFVDDDSASEAVICPELTIEKSNNAPIETIDLGDGTTIDLPSAEEGATVTYTLEYTLVDGPVDNGIVTDVIPDGLTYVEGTASDNAEFTFEDAVVNADGTTTLTWTAPTVSASGSLTYDVTVDVGAADLTQPLINVATITSDQTPPDDSESPVFVPPVPQELTPPPTDTLAPSTTASNPGFALMLILLAIAGLALSIGFITPVPEQVRRRDRLG
ncbi:MAG TPA: DUF11 domain-containing protein [Candidatus Limnocylindrales bacterium]|nr:DUF11 domain-containing protein [Candidatus Limnocylindrales bacterium]